jgi:histidinol dehydrogenase
MKTYINPSKDKWLKLCKRPETSKSDVSSIVAEVFKNVEVKGDVALQEYTQKFDNVSISSVIVSKETMKKWANKTAPELKKAIDEAYATIRKFHEAQAIDVNKETVETIKGILCWREPRAIERVGLYVPAGNAPLISTVLMLGVPAQLAGCRELTLCSPPQTNGKINSAICYGALKVGVTKLASVGGIQAIAALAVGTDSIEKVDKIFGPGNQFVTAAKQYANSKYSVAIDMPAGPSEQLVIADARANTEFVAADLLSQAEHGPDSQVVLLSNSLEQIERVKLALQDQLSILPRKDIVKEALNNSFCVVFNSIDTALDFSNLYAPEHLILALGQSERYVEKIQNAGSVFLGKYSPESAGDYASGTNHTLPTNGWARSYSGVSLDSFVKKVTFQSLTKKGLASLSNTIETIAKAEGLEAHARAVSIRFSEE